MPYVIVSAGRSDCRGARVIDPETSAVLKFASRADARKHLESIKDTIPGKYLPMVVSEVPA